MSGVKVVMSVAVVEVVVVKVVIPIKVVRDIDATVVVLHGRPNIFFYQFPINQLSLTGRCDDGSFARKGRFLSLAMRKD